MTLTAAQVDRAAGVLVGQACGDALGVPYELGMRAQTASVLSHARSASAGRPAPPTP